MSQLATRLTSRPVLRSLLHLQNIQLIELRLLLRRLMAIVYKMQSHWMTNHSISVNLMEAGCTVREDVNVWLDARLIEPRKRPFWPVKREAINPILERTCLISVPHAVYRCFQEVWNVSCSRPPNAPRNLTLTIVDINSASRWARNILNCSQNFLEGLWHCCQIWPWKWHIPANVYNHGES